MTFKEFANKVNGFENPKVKKYIYESPDKGKTIYKREFNNYNKREKIMKMMSLYEYLGHAAGPELGLKVATAAGKAGVITETRRLNHKGWKDKDVNLYPESFLDLYFRGGLNEGATGKQLLKG